MPQADTEFAIRVRDLVVGFGRQIVINHLSLDVRRGEILGLVGASGGGKTVLMRTIIGLIPRQSGGNRGHGRRDRAQRGSQHPERRRPVGHPVSAGRAVLVAHRAAEHPVSASRESGAVAAADGRDRHRQARNGRAFAGGWRQVSFRIVRRHDQAGGAGARAGAGSRDRVSRRADLGPRPDCSRRVRRSDQDLAENAGADGIHGHP